MKFLIHRSMRSVIMATFLGLFVGCTSSTNDPNVPGADKPVTEAPKNLQEWYGKNQMKIPSKKGAAKPSSDSAK